MHDQHLNILQLNMLAIALRTKNCFWLAGGLIGRASIGTPVPQTQGKPARTPGIPYKGTTIHTLVTSNGSPYLNFQNRIM